MGETSVEPSSEPSSGTGCVRGESSTSTWSRPAVNLIETPHLNLSRHWTPPLSPHFVRPLFSGWFRSSVRLIFVSLTVEEFQIRESKEWTLKRRQWGWICNTIFNRGEPKLRRILFSSVLSELSVELLVVYFTYGAGNKLKLTARLNQHSSLPPHFFDNLDRVHRPTGFHYA